MQSSNKKLLEEIAKTIKEFLIKNGGYSNGFETWAEGTVSLNVTGAVKLFTPACQDKTYNEVRNLGGQLETKLKGYLKHNGIKETLSIRRFHVEHGAYQTEVNFEPQTIRVL